MSVVGRVESLWRYPVKSMRGEQLTEAFAGFAGIYGDRIYAFRSSAAPKGFPYLTGREYEQMLLHTPVFRHPERAAHPLNLAEADALSPGITPLYATLAELIVDVQTPSGEKLSIDDPLLIARLRERVRQGHELTLLRSERALTDCRPISLFSLQTVGQLSNEVGATLDKLRFRANIYADLDAANGFAEDEFVGRKLKIGATAVIAVVKRDGRCKMITLDPNTAEANPDVMRVLSQAHEGKAGVYGAVLVEGMIRSGDEIAVVAD